MALFTLSLSKIKQMPWRRISHAGLQAHLACKPHGICVSGVASINNFMPINKNDNQAVRQLSEDKNKSHTSFIEQQHTKSAHGKKEDLTGQCDDLLYLLICCG